MDVNMNVRNGIVGKETWPLLKDGRVLGSGGQSEQRALHTRGLLSPAAWLPGAPRPPQNFIQSRFTYGPLQVVSKQPLCRDSLPLSTGLTGLQGHGGKMCSPLASVSCSGHTAPVAE